MTVAHIYLFPLDINLLYLGGNLQRVAVCNHEGGIFPFLKRACFVSDAQHFSSVERN